MNTMGIVPSCSHLQPRLSGVQKPDSQRTGPSGWKDFRRLKLKRHAGVQKSGAKGKVTESNYQHSWAELDKEEKKMDTETSKMP